MGMLSPFLLTIKENDVFSLDLPTVPTGKEMRFRLDFENSEKIQDTMVEDIIKDAVV